MVEEDEKVLLEVGEAEVGVLLEVAVATRVEQDTILHLQGVHLSRTFLLQAFSVIYQEILRQIMVFGIHLR